VSLRRPNGSSKPKAPNAVLARLEAREAFLLLTVLATSEEALVSGVQVAKGFLRSALR
jgi:hypothetical protein